MFLSTSKKIVNTSVIRPFTSSIVNGINLNKIHYNSFHLNSNIPTINVTNKRYRSTENANELTAPKQGFSIENNSNNNINNKKEKKEKKEKKRGGFISG
eukprot:jgi/Orpsp1_1/1180012/evm.model.c7180000071787.1